jgi:hypothetical protein
MKNSGPLPNFVCVGVEKAGTTSLYHLLAQHPQIGMSSNKETHFFNTHWGKGTDWYREKFSHLADSIQNLEAIGEITPAYCRFDEIPNRIHQTLGQDTRIIFLLREPCQRAYSHYQHNFMYRLKHEDYIFSRYLKTYAYAPSLEQYLSLFGEQNCLVLAMEEDMLPDPQVAINKVCDFLGINHHAITPLNTNPSWLPGFCYSPEFTSRLVVEDQEWDLPPTTPVVYNSRARFTRPLLNTPEAEVQEIRHAISSMVTHIPAEKVQHAHDTLARVDIEATEKLAGRRFTDWHQPHEDFHAKVSPEPEFLAI